MPPPSAAIDLSGAKASTTYTMTASRRQPHPVRRQRQQPDGRSSRHHRRFRLRDHQLQQPGRQAHRHRRRGKTAADSRQTWRRGHHRPSRPAARGTPRQRRCPRRHLEQLRCWRADVRVWRSRPAGSTATASAGVARAPFRSVATASGHMTGSVGGEIFAGDLPVVSQGSAETVVLTGDRGTRSRSTTRKVDAASPTMQARRTSTWMSHLRLRGRSGQRNCQRHVRRPGRGRRDLHVHLGGVGNSLTLNGSGGPTRRPSPTWRASETRRSTFGNGVNFTLTADANGFTARRSSPR